MTKAKPKHVSMKGPTHKQLRDEAVKLGITIAEMLEEVIEKTGGVPGAGNGPAAPGRRGRS